MTKLEKRLIIVVVILVIVLSVLIYIFTRDNVTKKELKSDLERALSKIESLSASISNSNKELDNQLNNSLSDIDKYIKDNSIFSPVKDGEIVIGYIYVGTNMYAVRYDTNSNNERIIRELIQVNNDLNRTLMEEQERRQELLNNLYNHSLDIKDDLTTTKDKVSKLEVTKTFSWAVGIGGSFDGLIKQEIAYSISVHGLMFIKEKFYVGVELGINKQINFNPKLGVMAGYKF